MENMKVENSSTVESNILFKPDRSKIYEQLATESGNGVFPIQDNPNITGTFINRSSMMTYSKIVCCICSAVIDANAKGMCSTCARTEVNITDGITKSGMICYCKGCDRYLRPPWVRCGGSLESPEMMILCLGKIKGLNKVKLVDSSFVWTEPHSKIIKLKLTVQKEMDKNMIQSSTIVEFKVEWTQCDDCKKTFTPHIWNASVQVRQKVSHKRTFMLLEQMILKHSAHGKAINIKEHPEGVDFYFANKSNALAFSDFVQSMLPAKIKQSKQLISHDQKSNLFNYKYSFMIELSPISHDDLIVLSKEHSKELGGIGPVLLCYKQSSSVHLLDPKTFQTYEFDGCTYWKYGFRSYVDRGCMVEFLIINVEEEIDYAKKYAKPASSLMSSSGIDVDMVSLDSNSKLNQSKSTNYKNEKSIQKQKETGYRPHIPFKVVTVSCIHLNQQGIDGEVKLITFKSHLGGKIRPGDIFLGYDLTSLNPNMEVDDLMVQADSIPDIILVKKKYNRENTKRNWKLKHLKKENDVEMTGRTKQNPDAAQKQYEEFIRDIEENKDLRKNVNLYRDEEVIKELEAQFKDMNMTDKKERKDSDIDIKVDELLRDLDLSDSEDKPKKKHSIDIIKDEKDDSGDVQPLNKNQLGKRERTGKKINLD